MKASTTNPMPSPSILNPLAKPFRSTRSLTTDTPLTPTPTPTPTPTSAPTIDTGTELLFHDLSTYPFHVDAEFQSGLSAILGHPDTPASAEEVAQNADLALKAQCFYFARQNNLPSPIDPAIYKSWLRSRDAAHRINDLPSQRPQPLSSQSQPQPQPQRPQPSPTPLPSDPAPPPPPRYPTSFNHIVDLITRNQPIPGIETIPDIVLGTEHAAPNTVLARRKPWETSPKDLHSPPDPLAEKSDAGASLSSSAAAVDNSISASLKEGKGRSTEKPLYGGLLGPLKKIETENSSEIKPMLVPTTTPSWQELAEEGATRQVAGEGDAPAAHTA